MDGQKTEIQNLLDSEINYSEIITKMFDEIQNQKKSLNSYNDSKSDADLS